MHRDDVLACAGILMSILFTLSGLCRKLQIPDVNGIFQKL